MFTGLVEELGTVQGVKKAGKAIRLAIKGPKVAKDTSIGDSIAVSGCCLTVVKKEKDLLSFDAGDETLSRTTLGRLTKGSRVNLERALQMGSRLGGHYVTGHIDAIGTVIKRRDDGEWTNITFRAASRLTRQMAVKGSIAVEGVSLTLVTVDVERFSVALIPHTLDKTTLGKLEVGDQVNLETDLLAKYVEQQLESRKPDASVMF